MFHFVASCVFITVPLQVSSKEIHMSVKIRLRRTGKLNAASHRIVVTDSRSPRDGRFIEILGYYDPRHEDEKIDLERVHYWIGVGAQPSVTVSAIIKRAENGQSKHPAPKPEPATTPAPEAPKAEEQPDAAPATETPTEVPTETQPTPAAPEA